MALQGVLKYDTSLSHAQFNCILTHNFECRDNARNRTVFKIVYKSNKL